MGRPGKGGYLAQGDHAGVEDVQTGAPGYRSQGEGKEGRNKSSGGITRRGFNDLKQEADKDQARSSGRLGIENQQGSAMRTRARGNATATPGEPSEHQIQSAIVDWCALQGIAIFAIPNGGYRHITTAKKLQREGVKAGVPDLFVPIVRGGFGGLFLEVKTKIGKLSDSQRFWLGELVENGYRCEIVRSLEDGIKVLRGYVDGVER